MPFIYSLYSTSFCIFACNCSWRVIKPGSSEYVYALYLIGAALQLCTVLSTTFTNVHVGLCSWCSANWRAFKVHCGVSTQLYYLIWIMFCTFFTCLWSHIDFATRWHPSVCSSVFCVSQRSSIYCLFVVRNVDFSACTLWSWQFCSILCCIGLSGLSCRNFNWVYSWDLSSKCRYLQSCFLGSVDSYLLK